MGKYDDIVDEMDQEQPAPQANRWEAAADDLDKEETSQVKVSMNQALQTEPDRHGKVLQLSKQMGLPPVLVQDNFDEIRKQAEIQAVDHQLQTQPKTKEFLKDPHNAAVSRDDIETLKQKENLVKEYSFLKNTWNAIGYARASGNASIMRSGALAHQVLALPWNAMMSQAGRSDQLVKPPEWTYDNKYAKAYDSLAEEYKTKVPELDTNIINEVRAGNYETAGKALASQVASQLPLFIAMAGTGGAGLALGGVVSASDELEEGRKRGLDPVTNTTTALGVGALETATESLGTYGLLRKWESEFAKKVGRVGARKMMLAFGKTMAATGFGEFNEEFVNSLAQDSLRVATGADPKAKEGMLNRALNAGTIGFASGGVMTTPTALLHGHQIAKQVEAQKEFYEQFGNTAKGAKLRERAPERMKQFIEAVTNGTPAENVYIPIQAVEQYMQGKNLDPVETMSVLGALEQYEQAKKTGADIKVPLATWIEKTIETEHYQGLAKDIKFDAEGLTVNEAMEAQAELDELNKQMQAMAKVTKEQEPQAQAETDEGQLIAGNIKEQLLSSARKSGNPLITEQVAHNYAQLHAAAYSTLAKRAGLTPMQAFERGGLRINAAGQVNMEGRTAYEQDEGFSKEGETDAAVVLPNEILVSKGGKPSRGTFTNKHTGQQIRVNAQTLKKSGSQARKKIKGAGAHNVHLAAQNYLGELLENAVFLTEKADTKGRSQDWMYLFAPMEHEGKNYNVKLEVKRTDQGMVLHNYAVVERTSGVGLKDPASGASATSYPEGTLGIDDFLDSVKAARGRYQFFQSEQPQVPPINPLGFYSQVEAEITKMDFKSMPAQDLANRIKNIQGIKKEELEWLGLEDWLKTKEGKITKEEVLEFVKANGVQVEQVVLGESLGDGDGPFDWTDQKFLPLSSYDRNSYHEAISNEIDNNFSDNSWVEERRAELRITMEKDYTDDDGSVDESALTEAMDDKIREELEESASTYVDSEDYYDAIYEVEEKNSGYTLQGNDERGQWYSPEARQHFDGNIEEAKIKLAQYLIEHEGVEASSKDFVRADEIKWGSAKPAQAPTIAAITRRANQIIKKDRARLEQRSREEYPYQYTEDISAEDQTKSLEGDVKQFAKEEARAYYADPSNPKNTITMDIKNPGVDASIKGNDKNGYQLTFESPTIENNRHDLKAKTLEEAKLEAIQLLVDGEAISPARAKKEGADINEPTGKTFWKKYKVEGGENYREVLLTLPNLKGEKFTYDTHFRGHENFVAHARITDRLDAQGRKTLFIEEIQSDWHQQGREKGYADPTLEAKNEALRTQRTQLAKQMDALKDQESDAYGELKDKHRAITSEMIALEKQMGDAVPDAPFKNTDAWAALVMKRLIRMAVEQGYQAVAWTPADVHVDRWGTDAVSWVKKEGGEKFVVKSDTGKVIDEHASEKDAQRYAASEGERSGRSLTVERQEIGPHWLVGSAEQRGGNADGVDIEELARRRGELLERRGERVTNKEELSKVIAETLGRERDDRSLESLTDRAWKQMQGEAEHTGAIMPRKEGMEFFYNKLIPDTIKKLVKKLDPDAKIEVGEIESEMKVLELPITDKLKQKTMEGFALFQGGTEARGRIHWDDTRQMNIELFKTADLSTFLHESGHLFLELMGDLSALGTAEQGLRDDYAAILEWLGVSERGQIKTEHHEKFARGFEAYLMEGKAPSQALRKAFANFWAWLTGIYKKVQALDVELSPEIKGVFDRMLATEAAIEEATQPFQPLFTQPEAMGLKGEKLAAYMSALDNVKLRARELFMKRLMQDWEQQRSADYKRQRKAIRDKVRDDVLSQKVYRAIHILTKGTYPDGTPLEAGQVKISKVDADQLYEPEFIKSLPRIFSDEGMHPDMVAEILGYGSGEALLTQIAQAPPADTIIDAITDQMMKDKYPDLMPGEKMPEEAMNAVHNESRSKILEMELRLLHELHPGQFREVVRRTVARPGYRESIRAQAQKILAQRAVKDLKPHQFMLAEVRARKEAGKLLAKGDVKGAAEAKQRELLNHELYRAAVNAKRAVEKSLKKWKNFQKADEKLAKSRDMDLVNAARAILSIHGIGIKIRDAITHLRKIEAYAPDIWPKINELIYANLEGAKDYKELSFGQFEELALVVNATWDLSKLTRQIELDGQKLDLEQVAMELSNRLVNITPAGDSRGSKKAITKLEDLSLWLLDGKAIVSKAAHWADAMDAEGVPLFKKYFVRTIRAATTNYRLAKRKVLTKLHDDIMQPYAKHLTQRAIEAEEIGYTFANKGELLSALLHTGNNSNLEKLLVGRQWGSINDDGTLERSNWDAFVTRMIKTGVLTKADFDAAQAVWDIMEELKPDVQQAHKKVFGYYFNEITADKIQTPFGEYRGGYVPAVADPKLSSDASIRHEKAQIEGNESYAFPSAGKGATMARVKNYHRPLILDINLITSHIDWALRFAHIEPTTRSLTRLVHHKGFRAALDAFDPTVAGSMLIPYLDRAAKQMTSTRGMSPGIDAFWRNVRSRSSLAVLGLNVINALQNFTGVFPASVKVRPKFLRNATFRYMMNPKAMAAQLTAKSKVMEDLLSQSTGEIMDGIEDLIVHPGKYEKAAGFLKANASILSKVTQDIMNTVAWSGAYEQAIAAGFAEAQAIQEADDAVKDTQGTAFPEELSKFEVGTPFYKMFTMFSSYFNMLLNLNMYGHVKAKRNSQGIGKHMYIYTMAFMMPAVVGALIVKGMSGQGFDEDDDDSYLDDFFKMFFLSQLSFLGAMVPGIGPMINATVNRTNDKVYDDKITTSPAVSTVESTVNAPFSVTKAIKEGKNKKGAIRDAMTAIQMVTGLPTAPLAKPLGYASDVSEGKVKSGGPVDYARGMITGKGSKK